MPRTVFFIAKSFVSDRSSPCLVTWHLADHFSDWYWCDSDCQRWLLNSCWGFFLLVLFMLRRGFYNLLLITDSLDTVFIQSQIVCSFYFLRQMSKSTRRTVELCPVQRFQFFRALKSNNVVRRCHIYWDMAIFSIYTFEEYIWTKIWKKAWGTKKGWRQICGDNYSIRETLNGVGTDNFKI